jgi:hypothetical protein
MANGARAVTDAQFSAWLLSETAVRCTLVEAVYRDTVTGSIGTEYMATMPFVSLPSDSPANQSYAARIKSIPQFSQAMTDVLNGVTTANAGTIDVFSIDAVTDSWLFSRDWVGRSITMLLGDSTWARSDYRRVWSGVTGGVGLSGTNTFQFQARDSQHLLAQPTIVTTIATGPDTGKPWPQAYGICLNLTPVLLDAATHKYGVHDGSIQSVDTVYQAGVSISFTPGAATGTFTLASAATGTITCDVHGANPGGVFLQTAAQLLQHFATVRGAFPVGSLDTAAFTALATACPQPLNLVVQQVVSAPYQLMDQVVRTVGAFYCVTRDGLLRATQFTLSGTPALTLQPQDIVEHGLTVAGVYPPVTQLTFRYGMNWTVQQTVDATVSETRRAQLTTSGPTVQLANPNAANYSKTVDPGVRNSLFVYAADAAAEATRQMAIWGVTRYQFAPQTFNAPARVNMGDLVTLIHPRYGLAAGRTGAAVSIADKPSKKRIDLGILI